MIKYPSSWRFAIALAAIAALAAFVVLPGAAPRSALADVDSVDPDAIVGSDGATIDIDITGSATTTGNTLDVDASGSSSLDEVACDDAANVTCGTFTGPGNSVSWDEVDGDYTATVALTLDCSEPEAITVTATHDGDSTPVATVYCVPNLNDPHVEVEKQADDNDDYTFDWDTSGGNCVLLVEGVFVEFDDDGSFDLEDNDEAEFFCEDGVDLVVDERDDDDFVEIDGCDGDDGVDVSGSGASFDIDDLDDTAFCVWFNDVDLTPVPTVTTGTATSVTIVLTASQVNCGGSMLVQVIPRSASGGPVSAGTQVSLTSSLGGSFQPSGSVTSAFPIALVNFLYTAPANTSGTTTLTARAGNVQSSAAVQIVCQVSPTTPATPVAPVGPLLPPSAGDGGLVGSSSANYLPTALAVAAAALVLGLTAATRRFAAVTAEVSGTALPDSAPGTAHRPGSFALLVSFVMLVVALLARRWR